MREKICYPVSVAIACSPICMLTEAVRLSDKFQDMRLVRESVQIWSLSLNVVDDCLVTITGAKQAVASFAAAACTLSARDGDGFKAHECLLAEEVRGEVGVVEA